MVVSVTGDCFSGAIGCKYVLQYMNLVSSNYGLSCAAGGNLEFGDINFGACTSAHIIAGPLGLIQAIGNYTISGGSNNHLASYDAGSIRVLNRTVTITGTPAFGAFAVSGRGGLMLVFGNTFSGSATGQRYSATLGGGILVGGAGATYLPGSSAGSATSPGWYS